MIKIGGFIFRWRDYLFPLTVLSLFIAVTPAQTIFGSAALEHTIDIVALLLILSGVLIRMVVIGYVMVHRNGVAKVVHANELYTKGMFGLCRNPLYLGNILIYIGAFLLHGAVPVVIGGSALFLFVYYSIIFSEENYLQGRFGEDYTAYCNQTPRLLPRLSNWSDSTAEMEFQWLRAVLVEDNVIAQSVFIAGLALWYESASHMDGSAMPLISIVLLSGGTLFVLSMQLFKRIRNSRAKHKN
jgi:protein-S-isoprenylcysteine O-methyltransferase Ste14